MKYQLAIFDLDGTILDTLEDLAASLNYALEAEGDGVRTIEEVRSFVGNGMLNLVKRSLPAGCSEAVAQKVTDLLKAHYKEHCADKTKPYDEIVGLLWELKKAGYKLAVVSNKADYAVQILCEKYFAEIFDIAVGERTEVKKKPAPDAVNWVLERLNVAREKAVYIGDSEVDIRTAENAEMEQILVTWGFRDAAFLQEQGAKRLISSVGELKRELLEA